MSEGRYSFTGKGRARLTATPVIAEQRSDAETEFSRFEALTKKLVAVSKGALDKKRQEA